MNTWLKGGGSKEMKEIPLTSYPLQGQKVQLKEEGASLFLWYCADCESKKGVLKVKNTCPICQVYPVRLWLILMKNDIIVLFQHLSWHQDTCNTFYIMIWLSLGGICTRLLYFCNVKLTWNLAVTRVKIIDLTWPDLKVPLSSSRISSFRDYSWVFVKVNLGFILHVL